MGILDYRFSEDPEKDAQIRRGLLDFGLSMLGQGGKPTSQAIGNSGLLALQQSGQREGQAQRAALHKAQIGEYKAQAEQRTSQTEAAKAKAQQDAEFRRMLGAGQPAGQVQPAALTDWGSMGGQTAGNPGQLDFQALARQFPDQIDKIKAVAEAANLGRPEVARTLEEGTPTGKQTVQLDKFGGRVGQPVAGYIAPQLVNLGDRQTFMTPQAGVSMRPGMSPSERDASARGWAGQQQADRHFKATQEAPQYMQTDQGIVALPKTLQAPYVPRGSLVGDASGAPLGAKTSDGAKPPPGYRMKPDGSMEAVPGGPADIKAGLEGDRRQRAKDAADSQAESVLGSVKEAKALVGYTTAGVGGLASVVPATTARDLQAKLTTIKANLGFDRLQEMRLASPTGGALGQVAVQELVALQATVASLDQLQSPGELRVALDKIERHYNRWQETLGNAPKKPGGGGDGAKTEQDERAELEALRKRFKR